MTDIDQVFARFRDESEKHKPQRELLSVRRRGSVPGSRTVEVVHVKSVPSAHRERPHHSSSLRTAAWSEGFPVKPHGPTPIDVFARRAPVEPTAHIMPAWQPSRVPAETPDEGVGASRGRGKNTVPVTPASADPFDPEDDGAN